MMDTVKYTMMYQTLFSLWDKMDDFDDKELEIAFMIFGVMVKMEEYWGE